MAKASASTKKASTEQVVDTENVPVVEVETVETQDTVKEITKPVKNAKEVVVSESTYKLSIDEIYIVEHDSDVIIENLTEGIVYVSFDGIDFFTESVLPKASNKYAVDGALYLTAKSRPTVKITKLA